MSDKSSGKSGADLQAQVDANPGAAVVVPHGETTLSKPLDVSNGAKLVAVDRKSPHEHAKTIGAHKQRELRRGDVAVTSVNGQAIDLSVYSWQHNAAAALHGWAEHEHHEAKPVDLSIDDYKKALLAASSPVVRAAVDVDATLTSSKSEKPVHVIAKAGDVLDLRKLGLTTEDLAMKGVSFVADYEPHEPALSKHAAHVKNAEANKASASTPAVADDSHLFAKA
jgi:hypothetical protein